MKLSFIILAMFATICNSKFLSIEKMELDIDPAYMKAKSALHSVDGINVVDLDIEITKEEAEVDYQITVYLLNIDHYEQFYKSSFESGCSHDKIKDPVLNFVFKESVKYGNVTEACPLKAGHYQLRNFKIDSADMPHKLPSGSYRFDFTAYVKKEGAMHDIYTDKYYFTSN